MNAFLHIPASIEKLMTLTKRPVKFALLSIILTLTTVLSFSLSAQRDELPLLGPVVAFTPAHQDRIILHSLEDGTRRELNFGGLEHQLWDFSPDGCRILFTLAETAGNPQMFSANLDGGDVRQLVAYDEMPAGEWGIYEPDWSVNDANGVSRIAFTMIRNRPQSEEVLQEHHIAWIDGTQTASPQAPQFYSVTGREYSPTWSADGAWLAYVSYDERTVGIDAGSTAEPTSEPLPGQAAPELPTVFEADMWVVSADGETKYRLTNFDVGNVRAPRWSPDGDLIGFIYSPSANNDTFWMIGSQQGALPTQLSAMWNLTLDETWLPDSSAMLASVRDFQGTSENRLWRIPLVGNADTDATLFLADNAFTHTDYPRFSPDGRWLAFRSTYTLVVIDTRTNTWTELDPELPGNTPPVWSPAAFTDERDCG